MQVRGSKLFSYVPTANGGAVAPHAGAWIETVFLCPDRQWCGCRPSCRGVDRNLIGLRVCRPKVSRPSCRGVDRNLVWKTDRKRILQNSIDSFASRVLNYV